QRVRIADQLRIGVRNQQRTGIRKTPLHRELKRVISAVERSLPGKLYSRVLGVWPKKLSNCCRWACKGQCLPIDEKWIWSRLHQGHILSRVRKRRIHLRGRL